MSSVQIIFSVILVLVVIYYFVTAAVKPKLIYQDNKTNQTLIKNTPALIKRYFATPWLFNTHAQLIVLGFVKGFAKALTYDRQDVLTMDDGGTVSVDWLGLDLPADRPTMVVLHTITGNADDFAAQLKHIQSCFPNSDLYATGISAGSGALAQYLGRVGDDTPIKAAMAYCPAYDMRNAFSRAKPFYSKMMAKKLKKAFVYPNEKTFGHLDSFATMKQVEDLHDYHQHVYGMAGNLDVEDYMQNSNPAVVFDNIKIPMLILNAEDDPVCHIDNVYEHQHRIEKMPNVILAVTKRGSHCAYFEGWFAKPWANRLAVEYFTACQKVERGEL